MSDDILADFLEGVGPEPKPPKKPKAPEVEPVEGSLEEAEAEGLKLQKSEARRAKRLANRPVVQHVGPGPEVPTRPLCRLCRDHRRLSKVFIRLPDGTEGRLCPSCVKQVQWDQEKRCGACGTPQLEWLWGGVCDPCQKAGTERLENVRDLKEEGWIMNPGNTFRP